MEIMKLHIISDFVSPVARVPQFYNNLFKWGALILALVATFTSFFTRFKLFMIRVRSIQRSSSKHLLQCFDDDDFDFSDDSDDASSTASDFDGDEIDDLSSSDSESEDQFDYAFRVPGSDSFKSMFRRRSSGNEIFSWPEFTAGKSVVKLWDSLGLGLNFQDSSESENSIWDSDLDQKISSFFAEKRQIPAVEKSSPAVVYLADMSDENRFVLGAYDRRISNEVPAVCAEWVPRRRNVVGNKKVYVNGGGCAGGEIRMGDLRNGSTPLNNLTESDVETWWDADGVMVNYE